MIPQQQPGAGGIVRPDAVEQAASVTQLPDRLGAHQIDLGGERREAGEQAAMTQAACAQDDVRAAGAQQANERDDLRRGDAGGLRSGPAVEGQQHEPAGRVASQGAGQQAGVEAVDVGDGRCDAIADGQVEIGLRRAGGHCAIDQQGRQPFPRAGDGHVRREQGGAFRIGAHHQCQTTATLVGGGSVQEAGKGVGQFRFARRSGKDIVRPGADRWQDLVRFHGVGRQEDRTTACAICCGADGGRDRTLGGQGGMVDDDDRRAINR